MGHECTSKDWVRYWDEHSNVIYSEPTVPIQLKYACTGQYRVVWISKECLCDDVFRRCCELYWLEMGYELVEDLSQGSEEDDGLPTSGLWIDDNSGKIMDFEARLPR